MKTREVRGREEDDKGGRKERKKRKERKGKFFTYCLFKISLAFLSKLSGLHITSRKKPMWFLE